MCCGLFLLAAPLGAQFSDGPEADVADARLIKKLKAQTGADKASLFQALGFSYFRQENFDRAFLYFKGAVDINPRLHWSWYYMGLLHPEEAEEYFKKAIVSNREFAPAYYWLGRHYGKRGALREAVRAFEVYLEVSWADPNERARVDEVRELLKKLRQGKTVD